ncbi:MAG: hypothetical protein QQN63_09080 [Nitrosopumilus sp.]
MAIYKTAPTFTLDQETLEEYREILMKQIMYNRFVLMRDGRTILWIDEELKVFKKEDKPKA